MRIVIDMQGAQCDSRERGIGRYTLSIAQAIVRNRGQHEVFLALNGLFPESIEPIRALFNDVLPQVNIRVWQAPGPVKYEIRENDWRRRTAELVREAFLASLRPDMVLVSSLMEGLGDDTVTSIGTLSRTVPTAVILYDLIPLIHRKDYLNNSTLEAWYENKLDHFKRADLLLAISESSRQEGIRYLHFPPEACVNISTAADAHFQPVQIDRKREEEMRQRYGLSRPFVMYTGGPDPRKNSEGLIRAFAKLPAALRAETQLVIIFAVRPKQRAELEDLAKAQGLKEGELVLTGFVPDEDLLTLYNLCRVFVFASWHEGFGLPALEAMSCGRAVIAADTSSLPEVVGREDALFNPRDDESMADKLTQVLTSESFRSALEQHGLQQAKRFSWDSSAQRAIAAMEGWHAKQPRPAWGSAYAARRLKLAYISPLPPEHSGISDYSAELLPELSRHYDIEAVVEQNSVTVPWVKGNCQLRDSEWFKAHADRYDRVLYHLGNSQLHQHMFNLLGAIPGVVVMHDFFLSNILAHMELTGIQPGAWTKALYQSHGYAAVQERFHAEDVRAEFWRYPCNLGALQQARGVIVHSDYSRRLACQWYGQGAADDWEVIPLLRVPPIDMDRSEARLNLGIKSDDFVVCSFGMLGPTKLNHRLLSSWLASALAKDNHCLLVFVGENDAGEYGSDIEAAISRCGLGDRIRITGWNDSGTFRQYLVAADVGVQLRTLSRGETSAAVLDCMNYGLPTIANANGSAVDLPSEGVLIIPDEFEDAQLISALETLWFDPAYRQRLAENAQAIMRKHHAPRICADKYAEAIERIYRTALTDVTSLTRELADVH